MATFTDPDRIIVEKLGNKYFHKAGVLAVQVPSRFTLSDYGAEVSGAPDDFLVMDDPEDLLADSPNPLRVIPAAEFAARYEISDS